MSVQPDLVTGDAVVLDLRLARLASRGLAFAIDLAIQAGMLGVCAVALAVADLDAALTAAILLSLLVLVRVGYPVLFESLNQGRTPGKLALGLRAVRDDGGPLRFRHALARGLAGAIVDFGPVGLWSVVAVTVSLFSAKSKRVGDYLAGTVVIQDRAPEALAPSVVMPPALITWAAGLELSGFTDDLALAARQYVARYGEMRPEARDALGHRLVQEVAARIGAPSPPGAPPWAYLMAVLAERRNRAATQWQGTVWGQAPAHPQPHPHFVPHPVPDSRSTADGPFAPPN
ncbi:RDD family protein [Amycolatopsis cynarae]|uniref:RDD family protein n=1 Tax=Amycolatopsis cynarae TaxID=2995223 RepID=A0ABY7AYL8_9PSEU|nr:RDD family protein [Amycolatopsis sp. HUAS 11-8]WAL64814.1 RDD family protein [Amycolatopsis sp. HUAS 11-8]